MQSQLKSVKKLFFDKITRAQFSTPARESIVFVKGMVGICQLVLALIYAVILLRYRSLVPAMCLVILTEWGLNRILRDGITFTFH